MNYLIFGAGVAGRRLASAIQEDQLHAISAFIDDNPLLHDSTFNNIPILSPDSIPSLLDDFDTILFAVPSMRDDDRLERISFLSPLARM